MKIYTHLEYQFDGQQYVQVHEESFEFPENGLALCKGASDSENDLNDQQSKFYGTLQQGYNQQFANQNNILSTLTNSLSPTVAAGPSQFGYSAGETNALNSQAIQGTAQQYQNAQRALQNSQAARGGGTQYLPSGVDAQNSAALAASGANTASNQLLGIQTKGYELGNDNYGKAISQLGGTASQYNPLGYAGSATGAGNAAFSGAQTIQQADAAANPWGTVSGLLGGIGGSFLNPIGTAAGKKLG